MKVEERLLLDGIDGQGRGTPVCLLNQLSRDVFTYEAEAVLAHSDVAMTRTQIAMNAAIR
jgi:hypothetical protein